MRTSTITALFAVGAIAQPVVEKRAIDWVTAVETVVQTVWVDADGPAPTSTPAPQVIAIPASKGTHKHTHAAVTVTPVASPSTSVEAIASSAAPVQSSAAPIVSSAAAPVPSVATSGSLSDVAVSGHNTIRAQHQAGDLAWDDDLAASAQALADTCNFAHNVDLGPAANYGQNIASSYGTSGMHGTSEELSSVITSAWYTQEAQTFQSLGLYGVANPLDNDFDAWGHFSQEVWQSTTKVGCAVTECSGWNGYFTVCNYDPPGNYAGEFAQNVAN